MVGFRSIDLCDREISALRTEICNGAIRRAERRIHRLVAAGPRLPPRGPAALLVRLNSPLAPV